MDEVRHLSLPSNQTFVLIILHSPARRLLKSLSIKQGVKYDDPASAAEIPAFIQFHNLDVNEILDPIDSFSTCSLLLPLFCANAITLSPETFNEFFYRKLKPSARPVEQLDNPYRLVSAADSRFMAFESVSEATKIWIKGRDFTVPKLLGENYKDDWDRYSSGGALCIFRLAPQDYHRFHSPVDGKIGKMTYIAGEYYTVNVSVLPVLLSILPSLRVLAYATAIRRTSFGTSTDNPFSGSLKPSELLWTSTARMQGRSFLSTALNLAGLWPCALAP